MRRSAKSAVQFRTATLVGGALALSLLYTPLALAGPKIHEVQPYPIDDAEHLVIWGYDFATPLTDNMVFFGTYPDPLDVNVAATGTLCPTLDPGGEAPPLDSTGFSCIVVDLPTGPFRQSLLR